MQNTENQWEFQWLAYVKKFNMYTFSQLASIISSKYIIKKDCSIKYLAFDSRLIDQYDYHTTLFFAIKGTFNDGHNFIKELYQKGFKNFCVNYNFKINDFLDANFIFVKNTVEALQQLGIYHRHKFNIPIIGITGSNGKTIVKEWLKHFLSKKYNVTANPRSYNSQIGVPLSVWELNQNSQIGIFEAGISLPNEMINLYEIIKPTIGVFTNIGDAHQENFPDLETKINEKIQLFKSADIIIYSKDYKLIDEAINKAFPNTKKITWSSHYDADVVLKEIKNNPDFTILNIVYQNQTFSIKTRFYDKASIENILTTLATLLAIEPNSSPDDYNFLELSPIEMRLEILHGVNNSTIINDCYNADLTSLSIAIDLLKSQQQHSKKIVILSEITHHKNISETFFTIANIIKNSKIDLFIGVGQKFFEYKHFFTSENISFYENTYDLLKNLSKFDFKNSAILIKGARKFNFENIVEKLQQKNHLTILEVNIPALEHNLSYFRSLLKPSTKLMVMVKAFSYGSGTYEISNFLQRKNIDYLGVAIADEGFNLRQANINIPIIVLNPDSSNFNSYVDYKLEPEIYNFRILDEFYNSVKNRTLYPYPIHIKINTGMNRLGFNEDQIDELIEKLITYKNIYVKSVFSHLAASSEPEFDDFTHYQAKKFIEICQKIENKLGYKFIRHLLNSGGIERFPQYQFEMVRLGIGLYGISSSTNKLKNISTLKTQIIHIQKVPKHQTVGYSRKGVLTRDSIIATIPIGYADGLNRKLSNGVGQVLVNGKLAPIVGNICMDLTMIDITDIPAHEGDEVIIFGDKLPITTLAEKLDTIPYEILTSVSERVKRIYIWE